MCSPLRMYPSAPRNRRGYSGHGPNTDLPVRRQQATRLTTSDNTRSAHRDQPGIADSWLESWRTWRTIESHLARQLGEGICYGPVAVDGGVLVAEGCGGAGMTGAVH